MYFVEHSQLTKEKHAWVLTLLWRDIFNKGMQVELKSVIKCVLYSLESSKLLVCNTSLMTYFNWKGRQTRH